MATEPKFPNVTVELTGQDGNAFFIIGRASGALRKGGATPEQVTEFTREAMSGDYDHVLQTVMAWARVS